MDERQLAQMATILGLTVKTALGLGVTPKQLASVFSKENILGAAKIVGKENG